MLDLIRGGTALSGLKRAVIHWRWERFSLGWYSPFKKICGHYDKNGMDNGRRSERVEPSRFSSYVTVVEKARVDLF